MKSVQKLRIQLRTAQGTKYVVEAPDMVRGGPGLMDLTNGYRNRKRRNVPHQIGSNESRFPSRFPHLPSVSQVGNEIGHGNSAPVLQATNEVPSRTRCCYSEIPNLSLHPRNSGEGCQIRTLQDILPVTNIRDNSVRLGIETSPVRKINTCSRYQSHAYMRAQ
jgi:hypothetical protein